MDVKYNEVGKLKILNAKLNTEIEKQKIEIKNLKKKKIQKQPQKMYK